MHWPCKLLIALKLFELRAQLRCDLANRSNVKVDFTAWILKLKLQCEKLRRHAKMFAHNRVENGLDFRAFRCAVHVWDAAIHVVSLRDDRCRLRAIWRDGYLWPRCFQLPTWRIYCFITRHQLPATHRVTAVDSFNFYCRKKSIKYP